MKMFLKKNWIWLTVMILGAVCVFVFWPKNQPKQQPQTATTVTMTADQFEAKLAEAKAEAQKAKADAEAEKAETIAKAKAEAEFNARLQAAKKAEIAKLIASPKATISEGKHNSTEGGVVRSLSAVKTKKGTKYQLLHTEPGTGRRKVLMYPASRPIPEIKENLSFEGFKPPSGELAVYDTIEDPDWGPMNVFAWKLK